MRKGKAYEDKGKTKAMEHLFCHGISYDNGGKYGTANSSLCVWPFLIASYCRRSLA